MRARLLRKSYQFCDKAAEWSYFAYEPDWRRFCWFIADKLWQQEKKLLTT